MAPPNSTETETPAEATLFQSLGHPLRRQILRLIHDQGATSYSTLRDTFHIEPGTLYFHLDQLMKADAPLLQQSRDRLYQLTALGRHAATFLSQAADVTPSTAPPSTTRPYPQVRRTTHYLGLAPLFRYLVGRPDHLIIEALVIVAALSYLLNFTSLTTIGFLPLSLILPLPFYPLLTFLASWLLLAAATELITRLRYHSTTGLSALLAASIYAWLPQGLYALLFYITYPLFLYFPPLNFLILFGTLAWSLWIYIQATTHTKRLALRKAALTTIIIMNITLLATTLIILTLFLP